ncbi:hypothetical protein SAMN05421806_102230 [Streptomyces indicus]|uniref:Uncharacterized protein n=1 Tax=Streptomyces indicus TaxID=417292 RepID=A0A1G8W4R4_9ACTN|nr:hypothetical protein [Streptomyces indicus]SDJ73093.1 hypothetical protein SAMN05421806_102230 [Streptomyces indicus]
MSTEIEKRETDAGVADGQGSASGERAEGQKGRADQVDGDGTEDGLDARPR